jgi:hypothetical protein
MFSFFVAVMAVVFGILAVAEMGHFANDTLDIQKEFVMHQEARATIDGLSKKLSERQKPSIAKDSRGRRGASNAGRVSVEGEQGVYLHEDLMERANSHLDSFIRTFFPGTFSSKSASERIAREAAKRQHLSALFHNNDRLQRASIAIVLVSSITFTCNI